MSTRAQPYNRNVAIVAAQNLFWQKGYHATSLKDLEATLNMKPGSIYAAFKSKENLYLLTLDHYFEASRSELLSRIEAATSPLQGLANHLRSYGTSNIKGTDNAASGYACMLVKTLLETTAENEAICARARKYLNDICGVFEDGFEAAKVSGALPKSANAAQLARKYQAYVSALRIETHRGTKVSDIKILAEDFAQDIERLGTDLTT